MKTSPRRSPIRLFLILVCAGLLGLGCIARADSALAGAARAISPNAGEVVRLSESGVDPEVVLAFIEAAKAPFTLSADDIIYLKDVGVENSVITAMLERDVALATAAGPVAEIPPAHPASAAMTSTVAPVYVTNAPPEVTYFYDSLEPYGTWIQVAELGWCWQPRIVLANRAWRPYWQGGRWIYTDLGWYWQSDYSWGWSVFHYGRWHQHPRCGWIWFPDRTWAPAWVSWRYSDAYCGWAPLPPHASFVVGEGFHFNNLRVGVDFEFGLSLDFFTFVEIGHLRDRYPHLHGLPPDRAHEIYSHTTVANHYLADDHNRIINRGLPPERFAAVTRQEVRPVPVRDFPQGAREGRHPDRIEGTGAASVLYRAEASPPPRPAPARAQVINAQHPAATPQPARPPAHVDRPAPTRPLDVHGSPAATPAERPRTPGTPAAPARPAEPRPQISEPGHENPPVVVRPGPAQPRPAAPVESPRGRDQRLPTGAQATPSAPATQPARPIAVPRSPAATPAEPPRAPTLPASPPPAPQISEPRHENPSVVVRPSPALSRPTPPMESPRGRDQRLSNGIRSAAPATPQKAPDRHK